MGMAEKTEAVVQDLQQLWVKTNKSILVQQAELKRITAALAALGRPIDGPAAPRIETEGPASKPHPDQHRFSETTLAFAKQLAEELRARGPLQHKDIVKIGQELGVSQGTVDNVLATSAFRKENGLRGRYYLAETPATNGHVATESLGEAIVKAGGGT